MNRQPLLYRTLCLGAVLLTGTLASACGGGGSSGGGGGGMGNLVATFVAGNPAPGANTISLAPGGSNGASFSVVVQITGRNDLLSAAFHVTYDPAVAEFVGFSSAGSFLTSNGDDLFFDAELDQGMPGEVKVIAAITDERPPGVDFVGTQTLITLNFMALTTAQNSAFGFAGPDDTEFHICPTQDGECTTTNMNQSGGFLNATQ
ncbi:MAG TPA: hypothetical protein VD788_14870 [Candidatus Polarisedimenticolaceae bacterium]|nr:hypothetical protein [Candidatus Polarisedimenticolaceae bacterium]